MCFIGLEKVFHKIKRTGAWCSLRKRDISKDLIRSTYVCITSFYSRSCNYVPTRNKFSATFYTRIGCLLNPIIFAAILGDVIKIATKKKLVNHALGQWSMNRMATTDLCYVDDMIIFGKNGSTLQHNVTFKKELEKVNCEKIQKHPP